MPLDLANDYKVFDGAEAITFTGIQGHTILPGGRKTEQLITIAVASALGREVSRHEIIASGGALQIGDRVWTLPEVLMRYNSLPYVPKEGDRITQASGTLWRIMNFRLATLGSRYRAYSRRP